MTADPLSHAGGESQFIKDIERSAIEEFNREHPYEQSLYNDIAGFIAAINWEGDGHWLASIAVVIVVYFCLIVCFRRAEIVQLGVFVSICFIVVVAEPLNAFLHEHWRDFSTQDYFDEHGVFLSCLLTGPLLLLGFLQVRQGRAAWLHVPVGAGANTGIYIVAESCRCLRRVFAWWWCWCSCWQLIMVLCYVKDLVITVKRAELRHGTKEEREKRKTASRNGDKTAKRSSSTKSKSKSKRD